MIQPNIQGLQEGAEINIKHLENLFDEIRADFSNLVDTQIQESFRTTNRQSMDEGLPGAWVTPTK